MIWERIFTALILMAISSAWASGKDAFLVGSVDGESPRRETVFFLSKTSRLVLSVVLIDRGQTFSSLARYEAQGGRQLVAGRLPSHLGVSWYQIEPKLKEYSNLWNRDHPAVGDVYLEPIEYEKVPIAGCRGQDSIDITEVLRSHTTGTLYIGMEIEGLTEPLPPQAERFAERSPLHFKYRGHIIQIVRREDDSYLGYLTELFGTPFLIGPRMTNLGVHETDARMGSDCAAFAIYGKRRQGYQVPYCGPLGIYRYLSPIVSAPLRPIPFQQTEIYATPDNRPVRVGPGGLQAGDIVHFGEQVSVFCRDAGVLGLLDKDDLLIQCYGIQPTITTIESCGFYHLPARVYRWRGNLKRLSRG
jgi:hypothetical protein